GIGVSHGDPIQAFWITYLHRRPLDLHHLQCAKGGLLALDYENRKLAKVTYVPPHGLRSDQPSGLTRIPSGSKTPVSSPTSHGPAGAATSTATAAGTNRRWTATIAASLPRLPRSRDAMS